MHMASVLVELLHKPKQHQPELIQDLRRGFK
jgi:hypothetical protein